MTKSSSSSSSSSSSDSTAAPRRANLGHGGAGDLELVIFDPNGKLRRVPLPPNTDVTIGRGDEATVRVDDPSVSRVHARFRLNAGAGGAGGATIEDLASSNGTRVGAESLVANEKRAIAPDTLVVLGELSIVLRQTRTADAPPPPSLPEGSMAAVDRLIALVAPSDLTVLVLGETGVGKEIVSRQIHTRSKRSSGPLLVLNCAALPEQTLESEVFGHEKGAFTGAHVAKPGLLESANGGSVLLDEVGEMPLAVQAKLLRAIDAQEIVRLGAVKPRSIDVRVIAATNRDLGAMVEEGTFRADLLYRLDGMTIHVPSLRTRKREIRPFVDRFVQDACDRASRARPAVSEDAMRMLEAHDWPGNVRELKKVIERAVVLADGGDIDVAHVILRSTATSKTEQIADPTPAKGAPAPATDLQKERERVEMDAIRNALTSCNGNQTRAAAMLGISRRTLIERLDRYALPRPRKS